MNDASFRDYFSTGSANYRDYRPGYPQDLFEHLAAISPARQLAWDCATGTGQAAVMLGRYFDQVIASDASAAQISQALAADNVNYRVMPAEHTDLASASIDLVSVAQALHWFNRGDFFAEVRRVLKPGGILAAWSYNLLTIEPEIDTLVNQLYGDILHDYWPAERRLIENGYRDIDFPLAREQAPEFSMQADWSLPQLLGYLHTWSATRACIEAGKANPLAAMADRLQQCWGEEQRTRRVSWPLTLIICRNNN
jgi:SAM-dependent methyltransferase